MNSLDTSIATAHASANSADATLGNLHNLKSRHMSPEQVDAVSKDFESMFLSQMMAPMFGDSLGDDTFGSPESSEIYKTLLLNEYGKKIEASGGIGIASSVKRELLKLQEI